MPKEDTTFINDIKKHVVFVTKSDVIKFLNQAGLTRNELCVICANFKLPLPEGVEPLDFEPSSAYKGLVQTKALRKIGRAMRKAQTT